MLNGQKKDNPISLWISLSPLGLSLVLTLAIWGLLQFLPQKLPLFYSLPWGDQQLATRQQFLIIPAITSLVTLLNLSFSWQLHSSQMFFKRLLLISSLIISLVLFITFIKIVLIFV